MPANSLLLPHVKPNQPESVVEVEIVEQMADMTNRIAIRRSKRRSHLPEIRRRLDVIFTMQRSQIQNVNFANVHRRMEQKQMEKRLRVKKTKTRKKRRTKQKLQPEFRKKKKITRAEPSNVALC